jgi:hypothetical protein
MNTTGVASSHNSARSIWTIARPRGTTSYPGHPGTGAGGWAMVRIRIAIGVGVRALALLLTGCGGSSVGSTAGTTYTTDSTGTATASAGGGPTADGDTSPPAASTGTAVDMTSDNGFTYRMSAMPFVTATSVHFDEPSIGTKDAPPGQDFVTVTVTVANTTTDRPEPLGEAKGFVLAVPKALRSQIDPKTSGLECPADYGLKPDYGLSADTCTLSTLVASVVPEPEIGDAQLAPGATVTMLVSIEQPVASSLTLDGLRLLKVSGLTLKTQAEIPVPAG